MHDVGEGLGGSEVERGCILPQAEIFLSTLRLFNNAITPPIALPSQRVYAIYEYIFPSSLSI